MSGIGRHPGSVRLLDQARATAERIKAVATHYEAALRQTPDDDNLLIQIETALVEAIRNQDSFIRMYRTTRDVQGVA